LKKALTALGVAFLAIVVVVVVFFAYSLYVSFTLGKDAIAYITQNVPIVVRDWNPDELIKRGGPNISDPAGLADTQKIFAWLSKLGKLNALGQPVGSVTKSIHTDSRLSGTFGRYSIPADFDGGAATIDVTVKKVGEGWQFVGFFVNSPALIPPKN
jgi:hypothetical protein